jgi:predicted transcriptional regulator
MSTPLTIQIPPELEAQITRRAAQLNISLETFVLQSLQQVIQAEANEYEDEPKEAILASLRTALQEVKEGKIHPIEELWDGITVAIVSNFQRNKSCDRTPRYELNQRPRATSVADRPHCWSDRPHKA